jgi:hypothetical protein
MNVQLVRILVILGALFAARTAMAQANLPDSTSKLASKQPQTERPDANPASLMPLAEANSSPLKPKSSGYFSKTWFVFLSAGVYGAGLAGLGAGGPRLESRRPDQNISRIFLGLPKLHFT